MLFLQDGVLAGLALLRDLDAGGWFLHGGPVHLDRLIAISVDATADSMGHIATTVQSAASLSSTLLEILRQIHPGDRIVRRCTRTADAHFYSEAAPLFSEGEDILIYAIARLAALHAVLDGRSNLTYPIAPPRAAVHSKFTSISAAYLVMDSYRSLLETQLRAMQQARLSTALWFVVSGSKEGKRGDLFKLLTSLF